MAIGDMPDMLARLKAVLPAVWFKNQTPVKDALLAAPAWMFAKTYALLGYVRQQGRVASASDVFLDIAAQDYTGTRVVRRLQETDGSLRTRLQAALLPNAATRGALGTQLMQLTGNVPVVFEPSQPMDTGAYGYGGLGYNAAGGYGSVSLPFQAFVRVKRPVSQGVPNWGGYNGAASKPAYAPGGYGVGLFAYSDIAQAFDGVTDAEIYQAVSALQPAGSTAWTQIHA